MGEIRVAVRLTNEFDEMQGRRGQLPPERIRTFEAEGVVDTESIRCFIPPALAERLGLQVRGWRPARAADGPQRVFPLTSPIIFEILGQDTVEEALIAGDNVRIGHTVLAKLDLLADCPNQRLIPAHPDGPVSKVK